MSTLYRMLRRSVLVVSRKQSLRQRSHLWRPFRSLNGHKGLFYDRYSFWKEEKNCLSKIPSELDLFASPPVQCILRQERHRARESSSHTRSCFVGHVKEKQVLRLIVLKWRNAVRGCVTLWTVSCKSKKLNARVIGICIKCVLVNGKSCGLYILCWIIVCGVVYRGKEGLVDCREGAPHYELVPQNATAVHLQEVFHQRQCCCETYLPQESQYGVKKSIFCMAHVQYFWLHV